MEALNRLTLSFGTWQADWFRSPRIYQRHDVLHAPKRLAEPGRHGGGAFQGFVHPHEIVPDGVERNHGIVRLELLVKALVRRVKRRIASAG